MSTHIGARHDRAELDLAELAVRLLETVQNPVVLWDAAGYPIVFNSECLRVFGYSESQFAALNERDLVESTEPASPPAALTPRDGGTDAEGDRRRLRSRSGTPIEVDCRSSDVRLVDGTAATLVEYQDVTALVAAQTSLRQHDQLYQGFADSTAGIIFTTGSDNRFVTANQAWLDLLGLSIQELRTLTLAELVHPDQGARTLETREARNAGRNVNSFVLPVRSRDGAVRWIDLDLHLVMDDEGRLLGMQGFGHDVTDEHEERERLLAEASTDGLTGLANRRHFDEFLNQQVASAVRYRTPLSLIALDLDHFKRLNDRYGHPAGDDVLRALGHILREIGRESDLVARYGGEEFAIVLPNTSQEGALQAAERCARAIEEIEILHNGQVLRVTASFGVATFDQVAHGDAAGLLKAADTAVYAAKAAGRNTIRTDKRLAA